MHLGRDREAAEIGAEGDALGQPRAIDVVGEGTRRPRQGQGIGCVASHHGIDIEGEVATLRAIGPCTESVSKGSTWGPAATRPGLGRKPTTEQKLAGVRRLPPKSEPWASQTSPVAKATTTPRGAAAGQGRVPGSVTRASLKVLPPAPNSGVWRLAMTMPPCCWSRLDQDVEWGEMCSA